MSSAKAALESDTRLHTFLESPMVLPHAYSYLQAFFSVQVLAYEAGRKGKIRVNTISAGNYYFLLFLSQESKQVHFRRSCRTEFAFGNSKRVHFGL